MSSKPARARLQRVGIWAVYALGLGFSTGAAAQQSERPCSEITEEQVLKAQEPPPVARVEVTETEAPRPLTGYLWGAAAVGRGLRFNNPFRLGTPLGETPESLSLTASYLDLSLGAALGRMPGASHGAVARLSIALQGVGQQTLTPGYVQLWRLTPRWLLLGRLGVPIVTRPDVNAGLEGAFGALWFATAGTGITAEFVGSMFYGAATRERDRTAIPVASLQIGVFLDYEVIP